MKIKFFKFSLLWSSLVFLLVGIASLIIGKIKLKDTWVDQTTGVLHEPGFGFFPLGLFFIILSVILFIIFIIKVLVKRLKK